MIRLDGPLDADQHARLMEIVNSCPVQRDGGLCPGRNRAGGYLIPLFHAATGC
jgi:hypothetical protein